MIQSLVSFSLPEKAKMKICNLVYTARVQPYLTQRLTIHAHGTCIVHPSGHVYMTGLKRRRDAMAMFNLIIPPQAVILRPPTLVNCVMKSRLSHYHPRDAEEVHVDLAALEAVGMPGWIVDRPAGFDSVVLSREAAQQQRRGTCQVFANGALLCMGCRHVREAKRMLQQMKLRVAQFVH